MSAVVERSTEITAIYNKGIESYGSNYPKCAAAMESIISRYVDIDGLKSTDAKTSKIARTIIASIPDTNDLQTVGRAFQRYAYCLTNISEDDYNRDLYKNIVAISHEIFSSECIKAACYADKTDLYYNTEYRLRDGLKEQIAAFDKALERDPSLDMKLKVTNMRGVLQWHAGNKDTALATFSGIAKEIKDDEVTTFDQANRCHNFAIVLFKHGGESYTVAVSELFSKAITYAEAQEKPHDYFVTWYQAYASFLSDIGNHESSKTYTFKAKALMAEMGIE
jgi:tetratricopeptide (TPR) repeat protein